MGLPWWGCLGCAPGGDQVPASAVPCILEMRKASCRLDLQGRTGGFLLGSYAAEKLEWKHLDQMAGE